MIISGKIGNKPSILELFDEDLAKCRAKVQAKPSSESESEPSAEIAPSTNWASGAEMILMDVSTLK